MAKRQKLSEKEKKIHRKISNKKYYEKNKKKLLANQKMKYLQKKGEEHKFKLESNYVPNKENRKKANQKYYQKNKLRILKSKRDKYIIMKNHKNSINQIQNQLN